MYKQINERSRYAYPQIHIFNAFMKFDDNYICKVFYCNYVHQLLQLMLTSHSWIEVIATFAIVCPYFYANLFFFRTAWYLISDRNIIFSYIVVGILSNCTTFNSVVLFAFVFTHSICNESLLLHVSRRAIALKHIRERVIKD